MPSAGYILLLLQQPPPPAPIVDQGEPLLRRIRHIPITGQFTGMVTITVAFADRFLGIVSILRRELWNGIGYAALIVPTVYEFLSRVTVTAIMEDIRKAAASVNHAMSTERRFVKGTVVVHGIPKKIRRFGHLRFSRKPRT